MEEWPGLGFQEAAWAAAGPGHQSLQLMFIFKTPNVRSGRLLPTKKANDFHASSFPHLNPTAKTSVPLPPLPSDWHPVSLRRYNPPGECPGPSGKAQLCYCSLSEVVSRPQNHGGSGEH